MPLLNSDFHTKILLEELTPEIKKKRILYAHQLAEAFARMHKMNRAYNDMKPQNILYNAATDEVILCDLASIAKFGKREIFGTFPAPELASDPSDQDIWVTVTPKNDCWAFGLTLYALLYGKTAYETITKNATWHAGAVKILQTTTQIMTQLIAAGDHRTDPGKLIIDLLAVNPKDRTYSPRQTTAEMIASRLIGRVVPSKTLAAIPTKAEVIENRRGCIRDIADPLSISSI